jgi:hypothetical protein
MDVPEIGRQNGQAPLSILARAVRGRVTAPADPVGVR